MAHKCEHFPEDYSVGTAMVHDLRKKKNKPHILFAKNDEGVNEKFEKLYKLTVKISALHWKSGSMLKKKSHQVVPSSQNKELSITMN